MTGRGPQQTSPGAGRLLLLLMGAVPVIVAVALVVALLLTRSGVGFLVGVGVPFVIAMGAILALGILLGRAATKRNRKTPETTEESSDAKDRRHE